MWDGWEEVGVRASCSLPDDAAPGRPTSLPNTPVASGKVASLGQFQMMMSPLLLLRSPTEGSVVASAAGAVRVSVLGRAVSGEFLPHLLERSSTKGRRAHI